MQEIDFSKYSGAGNDFILIDNRAQIFRKEWVSLLCHRHEGIGADGILLLDSLKDNLAKMLIFNADGSPAAMCGNGIRCFTLFLKELGMTFSPYTIGNSESKVFQTFLCNNGNIAVQMNGVFHTSFFQSCQIDDKKIEYHFLNTGVPHIVIFTPHLEEINVEDLGKKLRFHKNFYPEGTNVNFAHIDKDHIIHVRTYERGVEKETLACGTGSCASALAASQLYHLQSPLRVKVRSKATLIVNFHKQNGHFSQLSLEGPAKKVFEGSFFISQSGIL